MIALFPALAALIIGQSAIVVDDFESLGAWKAVPSDGVTLNISGDAGLHGKAMRIDFDFHGHGGYAVVHRDLKLPLPANYEFSFAVRGPAPVNTLEFKLIDPSGDNVWWSNNPGFVFPPDWKTVARKKRQISFAWGPLGGGDMKNVAGLEIAITAGTGGKGTVWLDDLMLMPLEPDGPYTLTPKVTASSSASGHPASMAMDNSATTSWRPVTTATGNQTLDIDFLKRREFGGLVIDWESAMRPASYTVSTSIDGSSFTPVYAFSKSGVSRDYLYLPESDARYVRINAHSATRIGMKEIAVELLAWSATKNDFLKAVAHDAAPGSYPRYLSDKQSYWTVVGVIGDTHEALIDTRGMIETGKAQFSIEPFLKTGGRFTTWADVRTTPSDAKGYLPIPSVTWTSSPLELTITAVASGKSGSSFLIGSYRVRNTTASRQTATLYLAIRPFQVNPPWQFLNTPGGFAAIDSISSGPNGIRVNGDRGVFPVSPPTDFTALSFQQGNLVDLLKARTLPYATFAHDELGLASAVLSYDIALAPHGDSTISVIVPLHESGPTCTIGRSHCTETWVASQLDAAKTGWESDLNHVQIQLPKSASDITESIRANLAYILINRDGAGIQPGSRSYERSWIRDGSLTSTALLRLGHFSEVRDYINWYAGYQFDNGKIPCCVDTRGADPVPENDSQGEFIYLVAEYYRHTGDRALLENMWPHVARTFAFMDSLRLSRTTPEFQSGDKRVLYGLMPQSISHEGYSAKPMHSYWDDFFALRGYKDATGIASILGKPEAGRYAAARDQFRKDFYASILLSMAQHNIDYIPGAVELGDFDATSTTIAINPADELAHLPQPALNRTFQKYYENFVNRRDSAVWEGYTPYEWRTVGAFVRMGDKAKALEISDFFMHDQRPKAWHQWSEVVYRDSLNPHFIGDMPHTWVGSDFIRSTLDMFAFEREADSSLVIGGGIPEKWVREDSGVGIHGLSTHYGILSYTMKPVGAAIEVRVNSGTRIPRGGLIVRSPSDRPIRRALVNSSAASAGKGEVVVRRLPAVVRFEY